MKKVIKKILDFVFNAKNEKLILIGLPCISIIIAGLIIFPVFKTVIDQTNENISTQNAVLSDEINSDLQLNTPVLSLSPTIIQEENNNDNETQTQTVNTHLTATSTERDLYIFVKDDNNQPINYQTFKLSVTYPGGQVGSYNTQSDGSCYLINLEPGTYTVAMQSKDNFTTAESIECTVNDRISYTYIEDIEDIVDIIDVNEIIEEVKTNDFEAPQDTVAEVIDIREDADDIPVYDSNGNLTYTYTWAEDEDGHLLDSNGSPTDVYPYYEEEGKLLWGFRLDGSYCQEEVQLINSDNTPVSGYSITAIPVTMKSKSGWFNENGNVFYQMEDGTKAVGLKKIDDKIYYFDSNGNKYSSVGIDVSFYNGTVNWNAVKNSGIDFVIIRLGGRGWGTGVLYDDSCYYNYISGARAAGLKIGVYFYSAAVNRVEAVQEASIVIDRLNGISLDYPVFIDMEYSGDYPNGRTDNLSRAERVEICKAFCETIKNAGYKSGLYSSQSFLSEGLDYNSVSSNVIWMASYTENNNIPLTEYRYDIWQISDRGRVSGINGYVDINVIK